MRKTLVALSVPSVQEHFDLLVPSDLEIGVLTKLIMEGIAELCSGRYTPSSIGMLVLQESDILLRPDRTLSYYDVADGTQLMLF